MMKKRVLAILGSPHKEGATASMLNYAVQIAEEQGYCIDYVNLYDKKIGYCMGCRACMKTEMCVKMDETKTFPNPNSKAIPKSEGVHTPIL